MTSNMRTQAVRIKAVLGLQGGLWVFRKSQKISTASDQYFLSYVKKNTGGGGQIGPPPPAYPGLQVPSRDRVNKKVIDNFRII